VGVRVGVAWRVGVGISVGVDVGSGVWVGGAGVSVVVGVMGVGLADGIVVDVASCTAVGGIGDSVAVGGIAVDVGGSLGLGDASTATPDGVEAPRSRSCVPQPTRLSDRTRARSRNERPPILIVNLFLTGIMIASPLRWPEYANLADMDGQAAERLAWNKDLGQSEDPCPAHSRQVRAQPLLSQNSSTAINMASVETAWTIIADGDCTTSGLAVKKQTTRQSNRPCCQRIGLTVTTDRDTITAR
jgi:hypothetical protein